MKKAISITLIIFTITLFSISCATVKHLDALDSNVKNTVTASDKNSNDIKTNKWMVDAVKNTQGVIPLFLPF
jgi:hypothetical protein